MDRVSRGRSGEQAAETYLEGQGYKILGRNQRTPAGELDIICRDIAETVVVEVKSRTSEEYGAAIEAIGPRKATRLRAAALWWLSDRRLYPCAVRFDAVVVSLDPSGAPLELQHLKNVVD